MIQKRFFKRVRFIRISPSLQQSKRIKSPYLLNSLISVVFQYSKNDENCKSFALKRFNICPFVSHMDEKKTTTKNLKMKKMKMFIELLFLLISTHSQVYAMIPLPYPNNRRDTVESVEIQLVVAAVKMMLMMMVEVVVAAAMMVVNVNLKNYYCDNAQGLLLTLEWQWFDWLPSFFLYFLFFSFLLKRINFNSFILRVHFFTFFLL